MIKNNLIFEDSSAEIEERHSKAFFECYTTGVSMGKKGGDFLAFIYIYKQAIARVHFPPLDFPNICPFSGHLKRNQEYSV